MRVAPAPRALTYDLERLFVDQARDWVIDTVAPVLAWVQGKSRQREQQPFRFEVEHVVGRKAAKPVYIDLRWDMTKLVAHIPDLSDKARRFRQGRTAQREDITELAAYGLTFVAISALMPGRRVLPMQMGVAPDILFDVTPGALRGVETAGRSTGGKAALRVVRDGEPAREGKPGKPGKAASLRQRNDIAEVHLSLWCASPRLGTMAQLRP